MRSETLRSLSFRLFLRSSVRVFKSLRQISISPGENMTSKSKRILPRERETYAYQRKGISTANASKAQSESGVSNIDDNLCVFDHLSTWRSALDERCLNQYSLDAMRFVPFRAVPAAKKSKPNVGDPSDHLVSKSEARIVDWTKRTIRRKNLKVVDTSHNDDEELKALESPFTSSSIKPDITAFFMQGKRKLPVMLIEVDSSSYEKTLYKLALVLIQHLRWLRHYDDTINETTGFVFPKSSVKSCVSKMTMAWDSDELKFQISFEVLRNSEESIGKEMRECMVRQYEMVKELPIQNYQLTRATSFAMPLSQESCGKILLGSFQVPSVNSIIVANGESFAKYNVNMKEHTHMKDLYMDRPHLTLSLLPSDRVPIGGKRFLKYDRLLRSMSKEEAKSCLPDYIRSVSEALHELHTVLNLAHLDVRLENICFRQKLSEADCGKNQPEYEAVLIDLDRSSRKDNLAANFQYLTGVMYESSYPKFKCGQLDWRQLGILACFCMSDIGGGLYHEMMVLPQTDKLKKLTEGDEPVIPAEHRDTFEKILNGEKTAAYDASDRESLLKSLGEKKIVAGLCERFRSIVYGIRTAIPTDIQKHFRNLLEGEEPKFTEDETETEWFVELKKTTLPGGEKFQNLSDILTGRE